MVKLLTGILFSTALRAVVEAKLVMLGLLHLTSFILVLRVVLVAKLVIIDKSTGATCSNLSTSNLSTLFFQIA